MFSLCASRRPMLAALCLSAFLPPFISPCMADEVPLEAVAAPANDRLEGAIGLLAGYGPDYPGAAASHASAAPGFFFRYRRVTVTNASGFVTSRSDDVVRGLGLDLLRSDTRRINFALRIDNGRQESASQALAGMGDIARTLRLRVAGTWQLGDGWRAGSSWNIDALGKGGGQFGDLSFARERRLSPAATWTWGGSLNAGNTRYMRSYFGVSDEQSIRSGYPVYAPSAGLRDGALFASWQTDLGARWVLLAGANVSHLLGPALDSPLAVKPSGWGLNGGAAWRF